MFGSNNSGNYTKAYKYDIANNSYTKLRDIPYNFYSGSAVSVGDYIYLFGSSASGYYNIAYKYDIANNLYAKLENIPYVFYQGCTVAVGDYIYLFGSYLNAKVAYKYSEMQLFNKYIYIICSFKRHNLKLSDIISTSINYAFIAINNSIIQYPVYYGDGIRWNLLS